jgi:predicted nucleic acid-binding protein
MPPADTDRILKAAFGFLRSPKRKPTVADKIRFLIDSTRDRLKFDSSMQIVTTEQERAAILGSLEQVEANLTESANVRALKVMLPKIERLLRSPLLRADENMDRQAALDTLQAAIARAEEALPKATTDERAIERFREFLEETKIWKLAAAEVEPLANPVLLCKDILRKANTLMTRIPDLFAPKRHVTHFKTAPPVVPPAAEDGTTRTKGNQTVANETATNATTANETPTNQNETNQTVANETAATETNDAATGGVAGKAANGREEKEATAQEEDSDAADNL